MRIAIIGQKGIPATYGGVEKHVEELSTRLAKAGHEVFVYARKNYTPSYLITYRGVRLISLRSIATKHLDAISYTFFAILDVVRKDVDVIHFHSIGPSSLIWLVKLLKPNTPVVATFHSQCYHHKKWGYLAKLYLKFGEAVICTMADKTITVSRVLCDYAKTKYGTEAEYVPNGVHVKDHKDFDEVNVWGLEKGNYIVSVSRLIRHKGIHHLIKAYKRLKTDQKLVIVGDGAYTEEYVHELYSLAGKNQNIVFTGTQTGPALAWLFANACLFVQPSESEGLSISLLEAMAYGLPVLVSDIPENLEAAGEHSFVFKNRNVADLLKQLVYILEHPAAARKKGLANMARMNKEYNWDIIAEKIINLYLETIIKKKTIGSTTRRLAFARRIWSFFM